MANLSFLLANGDSVNGTRDWSGSMAFANIRVASDSLVIADNTNGNATLIASFLLSDISDFNFDLMSTLTIACRYRVIGAQTNTRSLGARIVTESAGVVLAASTSGGAAQSINANIQDQSFATTRVQFSYLNGPATLTDWNNARLELELVVSKSMGGDTNGVEVDWVMIEGTYSPTDALQGSSYGATGLLVDEKYPGSPTYGTSFGTNILNGGFGVGFILNGTVRSMTFALRKNAGGDSFTFQGFIFSVDANNYPIHILQKSVQTLNASDLTTSFANYTLDFEEKWYNAKLFICVQIISYTSGTLIGNRSNSLNYGITNTNQVSGIFGRQQTFNFGEGVWQIQGNAFDYSIKIRQNNIIVPYLNSIQPLLGASNSYYADTVPQNTTNTREMVHTGATGNQVLGISQHCSTNNYTGGRIWSFIVWARRVGNPDFDLTAQVSEQEVVPTYTENSNETYAASTISTSGQWIRFTFAGLIDWSTSGPGAGNVTMMVQPTNGVSSDGSNYIEFVFWNTNQNTNNTIAWQRVPGQWEQINNSDWPIYENVPIPTQRTEGTLSGITGRIFGSTDPNTVYAHDSGENSTILYDGTWDTAGQYLSSFEGLINNVQFKLRKAGSPVHDIVADIWSINGSNLPDVLLETSINTIAASSLTTDLNGQYYQFNFRNNFYSGKIAIVVRITNITTSNSSDLIIIYIDISNAYSNGNYVNKGISVWSAQATWDARFAINLGVGTGLIGTLIGKGLMTVLHPTTTDFIGTQHNLSSNHAGPNPATLTATRIAIMDEVADKLQAYDWNGSSWSTVGSQLTFANDGNCIVGMTSTQIAMIVNVASAYSLRMYTFNGSSWSLVGNALTGITAGSRLRIAKMSSTRVVIWDSTTWDLKVYDFDGTDWSQTGSDTQISATSDNYVGLDNTHIARIDSFNRQLKTYVFNGTSFSQTGNSSSAIAPAGSWNDPYMAQIDSSTIALIVNTTTVDKLTVWSWDGSDWTEITTNGFPFVFEQSVALKSLTWLKGYDFAVTDPDGNGHINYVGQVPVDGQATVTGLLTEGDSNAISANINNNATTSGVLTAKGSLAGAINGTVTVTVSSITLKIDSNINGVATVTGLLHADAKGTGQSDGVTTTSGVLTAKGDLDSTINNVATTAGILTAKGSLAGASNGSTTTTVSSVTLKIDSNINGVATLTGVLTANGILLGAINASATTTSVLTAKGDFDSSINNLATITGVLSGRGALAGASNGVTTTSSDLTAGGSIGALSGEINGVATIAGILTATGALIGASNPALTVSGVLQARGDIDSTINGVTTLIATLIAKGDLDSSINNVATTSGVLTANGSLAGESNGVGSTTSVLTALGALSGSSDGVATVQGALVSNAMFGTSNGLATTSGSLTAIGSLAGASNGVSTTSGALTSSAPLESSINGTTTITATLSAKGDFDSAINSISTVTGALTATGSLAGTINGATTTTSVLTLIGNLSGTINGVSTTSGVLTAQGSLIGVVNGVATTSSILTANGSLAGSSDGVATTSGTILTDGELLGQSNGLATTSGTLSALGALSGASNGVATVQGTLSANGTLEGASNGLTTTTGVLSGNGTLSGASNGLATTFGVLGALLVGQSDGVATVSGALTANGQLVGTSNGVATITSVLIAKGDTDSAINNVATTSGTLTATGNLVGASNGVTTTQGVLGTILIGQSDGIAIVTGTLSAFGTLSGASNGVTSTTSVLIAKGDTDSTINAIATTSGTLSASGVLEGTINGIATTTSILSGNGNLTGTSNGVATTSGVLTSEGGLESPVNNVATVSGVLSGNGSLIGVINGVASTVGFMALDALESSINGLATVSGTLSGLGSLVGISNGITSTSGSMGAKNPILGTSDGVATVTATLIGWGYMEGSSDPLPDELVWGTGNLFEAFEVDDESIGQTIAIQNKAVQWFEFEFDKIGVPDFEVRGEIWSLDGGGLPLTLLQVSTNTIQATSVTGTRDYYRWNFDITGINYDGDYALVAHIINHTVGDGTNYIRKYYDDNNPFTDGYELRNPIGVAWSAELNNDLNGRVRLKRGVSGNLSGTSFGISNGFATVSGTLTGSGALAGTSNGTSTASLGIFYMYASTNGVATVQGALTGIGSLAGTVSGLATTGGELITDALVGDGNGITTTQGTLTAKGALVGIINANSTATGTLTFEGLLLGVSDGTATVSATLTAKGALIGSSFGWSFAQLSVTGFLIGTSEGFTYADGTLTAVGKLEGVINGSSEAVLEYIIPTILFGVSNGQATVTGTLTPTPPEDIDSSCFHLVRYIEKGPYLVNYRCNGKKQKFLYNIKCVK